MLNLVATVVAVIVMIAVAVAGLSYLGPGFSNAQVSAHAAQFLNSAIQIEGAQSLARASDGGVYTTDVHPGDAVASLVANGYLQQAPAIPPYAIAGATWNVVPATDGHRPMIVVPVDDTNGEALAVCNELALKLTGHAGCAKDLSTLTIPN